MELYSYFSSTSSWRRHGKTLNLPFSTVPSYVASQTTCLGSTLSSQNYDSAHPPPVPYWCSATGWWFSWAETLVSSLLVWAVDNMDHAIGQACSTVCVMRPSLAEFCLHAGSTDFNTQNEEWIRVYIIISKILLYIFLYIIQ